MILQISIINGSFPDLISLCSSVQGVKTGVFVLGSAENYSKPLRAVLRRHKQFLLNICCVGLCETLGRKSSLRGLHYNKKMSKKRWAIPNLWDFRIFFGDSSNHNVSPETGCHRKTRGQQVLPGSSERVTKWRTEQINKLNPRFRIN